MELCSFYSHGGFDWRCSNLFRSDARRLFGRAIVLFLSAASSIAVPVSEIRYLLDADGMRVGRQEIFRSSPDGNRQTNTSRFLVEPPQASRLSQRMAVMEGDSTRGFAVGRSVFAELELSNPEGPELSYLIGDAPTSSRLRLNSHGALERQVSWDAFGVPMGWVVPTEVPDFPGYAGEFAEAGSGLYDLRARTYDPQLGRFTAPDPYEGDSAVPVSRHRYLYGHADPINHRDPTGLVVKHVARDLDGLAWGTHQFLALIPDHPEDFEGAGRGVAAMKSLGLGLKTIGGQRVILAGGHRVNGRLSVRFFERADEAAAVELLDASHSIPFYQSDFDVEAHDIAAPAALNDTEFIVRLLRAMDHYRQNESRAPISYPPFGGGLTPLSRGQLNSNAWASSILEAVGARPWPDFFGYDPLRKNRIPHRYFDSEVAVEGRPSPRNAAPVSPHRFSLPLLFP